MTETTETQTIAPISFDYIVIEDPMEDLYCDGCQ
jgi:hypothetical protein